MDYKKILLIVASYLLVAVLGASISLYTATRGYEDRLSESEANLASARANERGARLLADSLAERNLDIEQKLSRSISTTRELTEQNKLLEDSIRRSIASGGTINDRLREAEDKVERNRELFKRLREELGFN